jgi:hypothetical protein
MLRVPVTNISGHQAALKNGVTGISTTTLDQEAATKPSLPMDKRSRQLRATYAAILLKAAAIDGRETPPLGELAKYHCVTPADLLEARRKEGHEVRQYTTPPKPAPFTFDPAPIVVATTPAPAVAPAPAASMPEPASDLVPAWEEGVPNGSPALLSMMPLLRALANDSELGSSSRRLLAEAEALKAKVMATAAPAPAPEPNQRCSD